MKKLLLTLLFPVLCFSQKNEVPDQVNVILVATVVQSTNGSALLISRNFGKYFRIDSELLEEGREYYMNVSIDVEEKYLKHCSGCTGVLDAKLNSFSASLRQTRLDILAVNRSRLSAN